MDDSTKQTTEEKQEDKQEKPVDYQLWSLRDAALFQATGFILE